MGVPGEVLEQALKLHKLGEFDRASRLYNALLNRNPFQEDLLFLLGDVYLRVGQNGLGINLLSSLLQLNPKNAEAWCNLGIGYRAEDMVPEAIRCWDKALELQGDTTAVCSNMAGIYSDRSEPEKALHWIDRALAVKPDMTEAHWQRGLSMLTMRNWAEGWPEYEYRLKLDTFDNRASLGLEYWDWQPTEHLYIHGEQGVGDEIMFLSCLDEVLPLAKHVTLEVNAKVAGIAKATWPQVRVITEPVPGSYTAKIAIGSMAARLRRTEGSFPGKPYLRPDEALVQAYRTRLEALGPAPYVGIAWHGGQKKTRVVERSMGLEDLSPILTGYTCVSCQYESGNPYIGQDREDHGLVKLDDESIGGDLHHQAALVKALDCVVTVQQTLVHVAGAVGTPAFVMVNARPHWRYLQTGQMPWYHSVRLIRQKEQGEWAQVINEVEGSLANLKRIRRAQSADARAA